MSDIDNINWPTNEDGYTLHGLIGKVYFYI